VGLILSAIGWSEEQTASGAGGGWIVMAMGCMIFAVGRTLGEGNSCRQADKIFWPLNLWLLAPVPLAALAWGCCASAWAAISALQKSGSNPG
jgi:hypothetical protein